MQLQFTFRSQLTATVRSFDSSLKLPGMEGGGGGGGGEGRLARDSCLSENFSPRIGLNTFGVA